MGGKLPVTVGELAVEWSADLHPDSVSIQITGIKYFIYYSKDNRQNDIMLAFMALSILESGIYIPGNGKALAGLEISKGEYLVAASQNRGALKLFGMQAKKKFLLVQADDPYAFILFKNGGKQKEEFYFGAGFLSQSPRYCIRAGQFINVAHASTPSGKPAE